MLRYHQVERVMSSSEGKLRSRQESTDSLNSSSSTTAEEYSDEEKDGLDIDDFQIIKTVGELSLITGIFRSLSKLKIKNRIVF